MQLPIDLSTLSPLELLALHSRIADRLRHLGICRTSNNPTADLAEWMVAKALDLELASNSKTGFDASDSAGQRYEIKARRTATKPPKHTSAFRGLENRHFDFAVVVLFEMDYSIRSATRLPFEAVVRLARFREHVNGHLLYFRDLSNAPDADDVTPLLRSVSMAATLGDRLPLTKGSPS